MTDLMPLTALGAAEAKAETFGALSLRENCGVALASLALRAGQGAPAPFGLTLPGAGLAVREDAFGAFWTGPDQWMIEGADLAHTDFAARVKAEAPAQSVTEQTDGWVVFDIVSDAGAGPVDALMRKLVNYDPRRLAPGTATRTGMEHMSVYLVRRADNHLAVIAMRSLAGSAWHALATAAARLAA